MAFTLNIGEFDLGAGFIGRGTILAGEVYTTTGVQGLLNTSGLEGIERGATNGWGTGQFILFKSSSDPNSTFPTLNANINAFFVNSFDQTFIDSNVRFGFMTNWTGIYDRTYSTINSNTTSKSFIIDNKGSLSAFNNIYTPASNWRFLARDHATSLIHYPSTLEEGSIFAASCVNSPTQWGLWVAGEVGNRSAYFNQTQGYFSIVMLVNGAATYFSAFSPAAVNSTTRNNAPQPQYNIVPAAGQSTVDDKIAKLLISRDLGSNYSAIIGEVPGFFYIDPNKAGFDSLTIGQIVNVDPLAGVELYDSTNNATAYIVGRWGADSTITASNNGGADNIFTVSSVANRTTLKNGRRVRFTTSPPNGVALNTDYWVINWNETTYTFQLAATETGAAITFPYTGSSYNSTLTLKAPLIAMRCY